MADRLAGFILRVGIGLAVLACVMAPLHRAVSNAGVDACASLFLIGLVVRACRWVRFKSAESARQRRAEDRRLVIGSAKRLESDGNAVASEER